MLLSLLCIPGAAVAFWLADRAHGSKFWAIGAQNYGFDAGQLAYGSLITIGILSILLCFSGFSLVRSPEAILRYFGATASLAMCLGLLAGGFSAVAQASQLPGYVEEYCNGGFPDTALITEVYLKSFYDVEFQYIERYMCVADACPCSPEISKAMFGSRAAELDKLDTRTGIALRYHDDCYKAKVAQGKLAALSPEFLSLLKQMETEHNCQGLCKPGLFYFFKSNKDGPPPTSCRTPIIQQYWDQWGAIGLFGLFHGTIMLLYFATQFRLWSSFG